ncbi:MAG TPA: hypothetical protein VH720_13875 [Candidatus Limnocylindrales bacterium]
MSPIAWVAVSLVVAAVARLVVRDPDELGAVGFASTSLIGAMVGGALIREASAAIDLEWPMLAETFGALVGSLLAVTVAVTGVRWTDRSPTRRS